MDDTAAVQPSLADFETRTFGDVTLVRGDCLQVMPALMPKSVNMVFADLPYGLLSWKHWDVPIDLAKFWATTRPLLCGPSAITALTATMLFASMLIASNRRGYKYDLVYKKKQISNFMLAKKRPLCSHEYVLLFFEKQGTYTPQMLPETMRAYPETNNRKSLLSYVNPFFGSRVRSVERRNTGGMYPRAVLDNVQDPGKPKAHHPTQKPVTLLEWLIRTYTNDGDTILDPVAGSGTTAIAAMNVGKRKVICIEKDPTYFEVMTKRVGEHFSEMEAARGAV